jgi:hypothetical protein
MTKTLNQNKFFSLNQNQNIFFSNIGNQNIFFSKKTLFTVRVTVCISFTIKGRGYLNKLLVSSNFLTWVTSSISSSCESSKKLTSDILNYFSNYAAYETQSHVLRIFQNFFNVIWFTIKGSGYWSSPLGRDQ